MKKCDVCTENPSKYCCPGCQLRTCCLTCVKKHKADSNCTGQRDKTAYVAMKTFTDINLLSDYRFLEDGGRKNNNASRDAIKRKHFKPNFLKELEKQAGIRKIDLRTMPYPMSRRKHNFTTYHYKTKTILWQIEWLFAKVNLTLTDKRVPDNSSLESVIEAHFSEEADPIVKHTLRPYITAGKHRWGLFLKMENISQNRYHKLDLTRSVVENLRDKCVIEYPTIHVVLEEDWAQYDTDAGTDSSGEVESMVITAAGDAVCTQPPSDTAPPSDTIEAGSRDADGGSSVDSGHRNSTPVVDGAGDEVHTQNTADQTDTGIKQNTSQL